MFITEHLSTFKFICHLFASLNKFIDIFLQFRYIIRVSCSVSKFGIICNLDILLIILLSRSFISIRNSSGPNTLPCGTPDVTGMIGWCIPVYSDQLTTFRSTWLHHLECRVHWRVALVFHVVPCQMILKVEIDKIYTFSVARVICVNDLGKEIVLACQAATFVAEAMLRATYQVVHFNNLIGGPPIVGSQSW